MSKIVISLGDPSGIGAEIIAKAMRDARVEKRARYLLIGDCRVFRRAQKIIGDNYPVPEIAAPAFDFPLQIYNPLNLPNDVSEDDARNSRGRLPPFKKVSALAGEWSFRWVECAAQLCLDRRADALITAPICKAAWQAAGKKFPGHTEFLGELCGSRGELMLLAGGGLRVALVTIHEPLAQIARLITAVKIVRAAEILNRELPARFAVKNPRIAILGLNPHCGESGAFGDEEIKIIQPAINALRAQKIRVAPAPVPADAAFYQMRQGAFDAILAMYHDQGLAALKTVAFDTGVNITLGLPIIRVSPDHGTAFAIAGSGEANPESLIAAIRCALKMRKNCGLA